MAGGRSGTLTVTGDAHISVTGLVAGGRVGTVVASADANAIASGLVAGGRSGAVTATGDANATAQGLVSGGKVGQVSAMGEASLTVVGLVAGGRTGQASPSGDANATITGSTAGGRLGEVSLSLGAGVTPGGLVSGGRSGTATVQTFDPNASVAPIGVVGGLRVGDVQIQTDASVLVTGVAAGGRAGSAFARIDADVAVEGVSARGRVGDLGVSISEGHIVTIRGYLSVRLRAKAVAPHSLHKSIDLAGLFFARNLVDQFTVGNRNSVFSGRRTLTVGQVEIIDLADAGRDNLGEPLTFSFIAALAIRNISVDSGLLIGGSNAWEIVLPSGKSRIEPGGAFAWLSPKPRQLGLGTLLRLENLGLNDLEYDLVVVGGR
jgi:hypothetical protein